MLIGIPVLRLRGDYLAIVTLAFGEIIRNVINCLYISLDGSALHIAFNNPNVPGKLLVNGPAGATGVTKIATFGMGFVLVLFTLFVCLCLLYAYDHMRRRGLFWLTFALVTALTAFCDWGILAPCMVLTLHVVKDRRQRVAYSALLPIATGGLPALMQFMELPTPQNLAFALYPLVGCSATIPLLWAYNGGRGRSMKWFFYAYYPAHIAVLGLAKGLLLGDWNIAVTG